jgi:hypothetical protein
MKKIWLSALMVALGVSFGVPASAITLSTGFGGSAGSTVAGITLGNSISFEYSFSDVTWLGGNFFALNASVINPSLGGFPAGQFNAYHNANTGWLSASINTASGFGTVHDLAFTARTEGIATNSAVVNIRSIRIDGRDITAIPEPGTLMLLGLGLLGLGLTRRKSS